MRNRPIRPICPTRTAGAQEDHPPAISAALGYSTVTDFARLRGLSMSWPSASAAW